MKNIENEFVEKQKIAVALEHKKSIETEEKQLSTQKDKYEKELAEDKKKIEELESYKKKVIEEKQKETEKFQD